MEEKGMRIEMDEMKESDDNEGAGVPQNAC